MANEIVKFNNQSIQKAIENDGFFTTLSADNEDSIIQIQNALSSKVLSLSDLNGVTIEVSGLIATEQMVEDTSQIRLIFILSDGRMVSSYSKTVLNSLSLALILKRVYPTPENPFIFKVSEQKSNKNSMYKYTVLQLIKS